MLLACVYVITILFAYYKNTNTVEALVSDHPRELKKVVATRTGRLREFDREIAQCRRITYTATQFIN